TRPIVNDEPSPADPHWPLVALTLLTQMSLGTLAASVAVALWPTGRSGVRGGVVAATAAGAAALVVSTLHLGRPAAAWKALRNLRRSWLSREVALFSAYSGATFAFAGASLAPTPWRLAAPPFGIAATLLGVAGIYASGRLYLVPARPVWNSPRTVVAFFATAVAVGPLVTMVSTPMSQGYGQLMLAVAAGGSVLQLAVIQHLAASIAVRHEREYSLTARLLFGRFRWLFMLRVLFGLAALALTGWGALSGQHPILWAAAALAVAAGGELIGRYLFFVTVTPMTAARRFSSGTR
ncbi:MAG: dimethyl sulfoxide reductase anchor subunit family protein, partial [Acidimicrobiales bacterium]